MEQIIYFAGILEGINATLIILLIFLIVGLIGMGIYAFSEEPWEYTDGTWEKFLKCLKHLVVGTCLVLLALIFIPSRETYLAMKLGGGLEDAVTSNEGKAITEKTITLIDKLLDTKIEELSEGEGEK